LIKMLKRSSAGFTLIEILIATVILGVSVVVIMQLFSGGLNSAKVSLDYQQAVFHAREVIEETLLGASISEGISTGLFEDGYDWKTDISTISGEDDQVGVSGLEKFHISVVISWQDGTKEKHYEISTVKAVPQMKENI
jgi:general secretion pathway protein I